MKLTLRSLLLSGFILTLVACGGPSETAENETTEDSTTAVGPTMVTEDGWTVFFANDTKEGWTQLNGQADYEIQDGVVTGTTKTGEPNSFLATERDYGDFILEYEVKVDTALNSGVQIRSHQYEADSTIMITNGEGEQVEKEVNQGRVYGYQVEIDPSPRSYSGGIYEEARRGWLNDLSENEAARDAFKPTEWNQFRVEANGDTIRTYVNGILAADLVDDALETGFIALQVHSVPKGEGPYQVMWRNIRLKER